MVLTTVNWQNGIDLTLLSKYPLEIDNYRYCKGFIEERFFFGTFELNLVLDQFHFQYLYLFSEEVPCCYIVFRFWFCRNDWQTERGKSISLIELLATNTSVYTNCIMSNFHWKIIP